MKNTEKIDDPGQSIIVSPQDLMCYTSIHHNIMALTIMTTKFMPRTIMARSDHKTIPAYYTFPQIRPLTIFQQTEHTKSRHNDSEASLELGCDYRKVSCIMGGIPNDKVTEGAAEKKLLTLAEQKV